jgi:hypothetical protein
MKYMGINPNKHYLAMYGDNKIDTLYSLSQEKMETIVDELVVAQKAEEILLYYPKMIEKNIHELQNTKLLEEHTVNENIAEAMVSIIDIQIEMNRYILNILTSFRSYLDNGAHMLSNYFGKDSNILKEFISKQKEIYDKSKEYRFMYSYRNYVQHAGIPIHDYRTDQNLFRKTGIYKSELRLSVAKLLEDTNWAKDVMKDLTESGEYINLSETIDNFTYAIHELSEYMITYSIRNNCFIMPNIIRSYFNVKGKNERAFAVLIIGKRTESDIRFFPDKLLGMYR